MTVRIQLGLDLRRWGFPSLAVEIPWLRVSPIEQLRAELKELRNKRYRARHPRPDLLAPYRRVKARSVVSRQLTLDLDSP